MHKNVQPSNCVAPCALQLLPFVFSISPHCTSNPLRVPISPAALNLQEQRQELALIKSVVKKPDWASVLSSVRRPGEIVVDFKTPSWGQRDLGCAFPLPTWMNQARRDGWLSTEPKH